MPSLLVLPQQAEARTGGAGKKTGLVIIKMLNPASRAIRLLKD